MSIDAALPRSARGNRTREALLRGAREVFERDGFVDTKITAITAAAGVAAGSFYTHFDSKDAIFEAVIGEIHEDTLHPGVEVDGDDPLASIEATNRAYVDAYERDARLLALMDQVALVDPHFAEVRRDRARALAKRNASAIRRWQKQGRADPKLDPIATAHALNAMTSRLANSVFVQGIDIDRKTLLDTLTRLWANALKLDTGS